MSAHWKIGNGFAIRYGGYRNIQWFKGKEYEQISQLSSLKFPPVSPIEMAVEISKTAALFLQWWEMRKQTLLQTASFEERRITWLADILATWYSEINQGTIRLDTVHYLDREISRLLEKIQDNDLIDVPSSLLLNIERSTDALVTINKTINELVIEQRNPNFILPDTDSPKPFYYQPYFDIEQSKQGFIDYICSANGIIEKNPLLAFSLLVANPSVASILWTAPKLLEILAKIKGKNRIQDFIALQNFSIELRSTNSILRLVQKLPSSLKCYSQEDIENGNSGQLILLEN